MLNTKYIYALLYTFFIQLGCSSIYPCRMESAGGSKPSSSGGTRSSRVLTRSKDEEMKRSIRNIVDKFLDEQGDNVKKGLTVSDRAIGLAIGSIDRNINTIDINSLPKGYMQFLSEYGALYGKGHEIFGPTGDSTTTDEKKAQYIASLQRGFKKDCGILNKNPEEIKCYWLIARIEGSDQSGQYYIDQSDKV